MARWKLMTNHYLNVPGNTWEYKETARAGPKTGRQVRREFEVPRLLDINDPLDWTKKWGFKDNEEGEIIVCYEGRGESNDCIFVGDPTPDMQPVDDEATAISASFAKKWATKPDFNPGEYNQSLIDRFNIEDAENRSKPAEVPGMSELVAIMAQQTAAMNGLAAALVPKPAELTVRRT